MSAFKIRSLLAAMVMIAVRGLAQESLKASDLSKAPTGHPTIGAVKTVGQARTVFALGQKSECLSSRKPVLPTSSADSLGMTTARSGLPKRDLSLLRGVDASRRVFRSREAEVLLLVQDGDPSGQTIWELIKGIMENLPKVGESIGLVNKIVDAFGTLKDLSDIETAIGVLEKFLACIGRKPNDTKASLIELADLLDRKAGTKGVLTGGTVAGADGLADRLSAATRDPRNTAAVAAVRLAFEVAILKLKIKANEAKREKETDEEKQRALDREKEQLQKQLDEKTQKLEAMKDADK